MSRVDATVYGRMSASTRLAWWAFFAVPVALLVVLVLARPATALGLRIAPVSGPTLPLPLAPAEEDEEEETEDEELEAEESEEEAEDEETEGDLPPVECLLRTARAQTFAFPAQNRLRLLIHYTSTEPTEATVTYRLSGGKGPLRFAEARQHLGKAGAIHLSETLSDSQNSKVVAADSFTVEIRVPHTPRSCRRFDTRHLTIEHGGGNRLTWLQAESNFGT